MLISTLLICAGLVLLFFGGEILVRGAVAIAHKLGMSSLSIGLTIVAFATSAPELAVSLSAALDGAADISIGNVVGSNIANIGLILALSAMVHPLVVDNKILRVDCPIMLGAVVLMCLFLADMNVTRTEGILLVVCLLLYVGYTLRYAKGHPDPSDMDVEVTGTSTARPIIVDILVFLAGLLVLVLGGRLLVSGAVQVATMLDISQAVIGLTIVAIGTSLPELATTLIAALRGYGAMAIGNIVGSNIFNILGILGITAVVRPLETGAIGWSDTGTMVLLSAAMVVFLFTRNLLDRMEGAILFVGYVTYTTMLVVT